MQLESLPSVAGIVQSAMVLNDALIKDWTFEGFTDVMGPKVQGYCNNLVSRSLNLFPKSNVFYCSQNVGERLQNYKNQVMLPKLYPFK